MATRRKRSEHYVNNKEFLAALEVYIAQVNRAKLNKKMGYITSVHDAKESLEKLYNSNNSKESSN